MQLGRETTASPGSRRAARLSKACGLTALTHEILDQAHPRRGEAEGLIEQAYQRAYDGVVSHHFPHLIGIRNADGALVAAAGFRWAHQEPLFLEQYLDAPIEVAASRPGLEIVQRDEIVEIGSLATDGGGASAALFAALAAHLRTQGATFAAATATRRLRRLFGLVGFETHRIAAANPARLADGGLAWGRYYEHDPVVVGGAVSVCSAHLMSRLGVAAMDQAQ